MIMIMRFSFRRALLTAFIAALMFALGFAMHKYRRSFYVQTEYFIMTEWNKIKGRNIDLKEFLSRQYSYDINRISLERDIDTALLPIQITGTRLSDHSPIPKVGGGITTIGNSVLILDRLGSIYSCTPAGDVKKLDLPPLPNNISAYVGAGGAVELKELQSV